MVTLSEPAAAAPQRRRARRSTVALAREGFRELTGRSRLIRYIVRADLKKAHADTALGQAWWLLDPVLTMLVYFPLFAVILQRSTPDFILFLYCAILPWKWFASTLNGAMASIVGRQALIRQIQFPKIVLPTSSAFAQTVSFGFGLVVLALLFIPYRERLTWWVLTIPLIAAVQFVFGLAVGIILSAANAFYRDISLVMGHALRLLFYLSPALYGLWDVPEGALRTLMSLNPMAILLTAYRTVTWGTDTVDHGTQPDFLALGLLGLGSLVLLVIGVAVFKRAEPAFARIL
jgi:ABC-type polysaccharide/polyol phosphate export permease